MDNWIGHILRRNCLLKQVIEGKKRGIDRGDAKIRKKMYAAIWWPWGEERLREIEMWSTRSHSVENSLWKRV